MHCANGVLIKSSEPLFFFACATDNNIILCAAAKFSQCFIDSLTAASRDSEDNYDPFAVRYTLRYIIDLTKLTIRPVVVLLNKILIVSQLKCR